MESQYLELIEAIKAEEASVSRLFGGEGRRAGRSRWDRSVEYVNQLAQAADFLKEVTTGRRPVYHLQEAMSTSDFPLLFGDVLDRLLLAGYRETPATYRAYTKISSVPDFRDVKRFAVDGAEGTLAKVAQLDEYPESKLDEAKYSYSVAKYGRRMPFSWETIINDDLGAFRDIPARFGRAARRTEEDFATGLFTDTNGPHASLYTAGNKNIVNIANGAAGNNPALSIAALQDAYKVLSRQTDADGEPIVIAAVHLVVPPGLEITAQNILNAIQLEVVEAGGTASQKLIAVNWMKQRTTLHVNYYIPKKAATANGQTSWFLFADPGDSRPALEVGFLRGHEEPEVFIKEPNARRAGGGAVDPLDGDFDNDRIEHKVRHVVGGTRLEGKATVASNGSAS